MPTNVFGNWPPPLAQRDVLAAHWWAWTGYAWLTNTLEPEDGPVPAGVFGAMAAMLVVALAVPEAFDGMQCCSGSRT
jgi:low temperature requirement protein LtrA